MARRALLLVVAGALVAAGCLPTKDPTPRPTQACGLGFGSAGDYQTAFDVLGHANTGWITADGFVPPVMPDTTSGSRAQVPDGRVVWWMSDTMTGTIDHDNYVPNPVNVHDSTVEQGGGCLTPHLAVIPYDPNVWYWPGSAVVVGNNVLEVFSYKVVPDSSQPYPYNWRVVGTSVSLFSLPSLQFFGTADLPVLTNQTAGQNIPWGIRSFFNPSDNYVYLYGTTMRPTNFVPAPNAWLARAPAGGVADQNQWQFFTDDPNPNNLWSPNFGDAKPMEFPIGGPPLAQLSVVPYGSRYVAAAFGWDTLSTDINAWVSDTPWGPWTQINNPNGTAHAIATFQKRTNAQFAYDAHVVNLPGAGWTVVYSANDPNGQRLDFTLYRGQFAAPNGLPSP